MSDKALESHVAGQTDPYRTDPTPPGGPKSPIEMPVAFGRYLVESMLGEGGFGIVYRGHDPQLRRTVAIKVPRHERIASPADVEEYLKEAQLLAGLNHPGIVQVHDFGRTDDDLCYVVSQYMPGGDLARLIHRQRLSPDEAADLVARVAEALDYAHQHGLVHRDIKPANILLDEAQRPLVADFGLALTDEAYGRCAGVFGTPAYMSPEQARGEGHRVDARSDIYSLGVVFYELLTGRRPYRHETLPDLLDEMSSGDTRPPRQLDHAIPKELERICLKAMAKRAADRYTTAHDLSEDLRHYAARRVGQVRRGERRPTPKQRAIDRENDAIKRGRADERVEARNRGLAPLGAGGGEVEGAVGGLPVTPTPVVTPSPKIVPKGLRSFDAHDADFFLQLLPGPTDRDGLPESIRFWKRRVEPLDADQTFSVGLLYGPSGCGKSSLVKAGLLTRLSPHVSTIFLEATPDDTEARLLRAMPKLLPRPPGENQSEGDVHLLPPGEGRGEGGSSRTGTLAYFLAQCRRSHALPRGQKLLIVIDQFEQWLHAHRDPQTTELVRALRQCDGGRVQCLVMVRDDFWLAASRFMQALEIPLLEGKNSALVDLFDTLHARKVLALFGRAYGRLPDLGQAFQPDVVGDGRDHPRGRQVGKRDIRGAFSSDQEKFLDSAVADLAEEGKVVPVRLALFAEMVKGKPWTPATLKEIGGISGVGVNFLEETFTASTAPPHHRLHQKAAQAVLKALSPEAGADIKGHMRSQQELFEASGYTNRQKDFDDLIRILDSELRLITPTDPEGRGQPDASALGPGAKYYQLTHDYLVPSLRDWLTRKQKETRRGRAELLLADRAAAYAARPDTRHLPGWLEWPRILLFTRRRKWTPPERCVMRAAGRRRGAQAVLTLVLLAAAAFAGREARRRVNEDHDRVQGDEVVKRLLVAPLGATPGIAAELAPYRSWTDLQLRHLLARDSGSQSDERLRASIGLLDVDPAQAEPIYEAMLHARPAEARVLIGVLKPHRFEFTARLLEVLEDSEASAESRLRAAMALAAYAPPVTDDAFWLSQASCLVDQMLAEARQDPGRYEPLVAALETAKDVLSPALQVVFRDEKRNPTERDLATSILAKYGANNPKLLVSLTEDAQPDQFLTLFPLLEKHRNAVRGPLADMVNGTARPELAQGESVTLGRRRAIAAIALLRQGEPSGALGVLRDGDDPESLTQFVHGACARGVLPGDLLTCLDLADKDRQITSGELRRLEDRALFGVLLALGDFTLDDLSRAERDALVIRLAKWHGHDPSSAIHGAAGWLLRRWGRGDVAKQVDETPVAYSPEREWFTVKIEPSAEKDAAAGGPPTAQPPFYITFVVFSPGNYLLGSPEGETNRQNDERQHRVEITRRFAISDREITWAQYNSFHGAQSHNAVESRFGRKLTLEEPALGADWFEAVSYCRWLTGQAGMADSEQSYADPDSLEKDGEGNPKNWPVDVGKHGFRLPTEAEWEIACRGGTLAPWSFGSDVEQLAHYAWFLENSARWSHPVGQLRPNPRGLFDIHGNVLEWCHDWYRSSYTDDAVDPLGSETGADRVLRGGGWRVVGANCRAASRDYDQPTYRFNNLGFRPARSL